ncbi:hypothetical protein GOBAR_DD02137 [Gossypium barbadense]|nr:hypothetical protein GOBAR_DD02137 [Gossypium barbadense]
MRTQDGENLEIGPSLVNTTIIEPSSTFDSRTETEVFMANIYDPAMKEKKEKISKKTKDKAPIMPKLNKKKKVLEDSPYDSFMKSSSSSSSFDVACPKSMKKPKTKNPNVLPSSLCQLKKIKKVDASKLLSQATTAPKQQEEMILKTKNRVF